MREPSDYKVSRKVGYASTLPSPPAYSFGTRNDRVSNDPGPGPGAYEPSLDWHAKGGGFGSSTRYKNPGNATPSPQDYLPSGSQLKSAAAYTIRGKKPDDHLNSSTPGPGAYSTGSGKDSVLPAAPAISLAPRWHDQAGGGHNPGPAEYNPDFKVKEQPGVSLKFRHERNDQSDQPGPGQYPLDSAYSSCGGKTFGTSRLDRQMDNGVPGPIYSLDPGFNVVKPHKAAWSIGKSPRDSRLDNGVPGPGAYGTHACVVDRPAGHGIKSQDRSMPAYTIPGKMYLSQPSSSPGPSDYGIPRDMRKSAPAFSIHGSETKDSRRNNPGPGAYRVEDGYRCTRPAPPAVAIGHRAPERCDEARPGPAEYNPVRVGKEQPGVSLKFRHGHDQGSDTPAPHDYADKDFRSIYGTGKKRRGYSFGLRHRGYVADGVPGPQYQVGASTLGIAAAKLLYKSELPLTVVL